MGKDSIKLDGGPDDIIKNFQTCAGLEVADEWQRIMNAGLEPLAELYALQRGIQEQVFGTDFTALRGQYKSVLRYLDWNLIASQDEWRELYDALGGVSAYGMSFWKTWKANHEDCMISAWDYLSGEDQLEAKYELIDVMHFMFNSALAASMEAQNMKFFWWNAEGEYRRTMDGTENLGTMLGTIEAADFPAIRAHNRKLFDFVNWQYKVWNGRMTAFLKNLTHHTLTWDMSPDLWKDKQGLGTMLAYNRQEIFCNWTEALRALLTLAACLGMTAQEITNLYYAKNKHNRERQAKPGGY